MTKYAIMPRLSLIIPVYNEEQQLKNKIAALRDWKKSFAEEIEIIIFDSNSTDQSGLYLDLLKTEKIAHVYFLNQEIQSERSIGRALNQACQAACGEIILILPVDVSISHEQLKQVLNLNLNSFSWGAFFKKYDSASKMMKVYEYLQNKILSEVLRQVVWTNAFFFNKSLAKLIPEVGFLEDLIFCDRLNKRSPPYLIKSSVVVNIRKYKKDGVNRRIFFNGIILLLFRCGYRDLHTLKEFYAGKINLLVLIKKILRAA